MKGTNNLPIGVFDSGVGGLTVAKVIARELPDESILYLGDTARVPYGTRSKETIKKFAVELAGYLLKQKVKCLVIACNTISANALEEIKKISPVPVFDVVTPVLKALDGTKKTGVIATRATVASGAYKVPGQACPLFIPLVEEGFAGSEIALMTAKHYLDPFSADFERLILGCTHFPIMRATIEEVIGPEIEIVDPAELVTAELKRTIEKSSGSRKITFLVTDMVTKSQAVAQNFWPESLKYEWKQVVI